MGTAMESGANRYVVAGLGILAALIVIAWLQDSIGAGWACCGLVPVLAGAAMIGSGFEFDGKRGREREHVAFANQHIPELGLALKLIEDDIGRRESAARELLRELWRHEKIHRGGHATRESLYRAALQQHVETGDPVLNRWMDEIRSLKIELASLREHARDAFLEYRKMELSAVDKDAYRVHVEEAKQAAQRSREVFEELQGQLERGEVRP